MLQKSAFALCSGLTSITPPDTVTCHLINIADVGPGAFMECTSLTYVSILNTVTIDKDTFKTLPSSHYSGAATSLDAALTRITFIVWPLVSGQQS